MLPFNNIDFIDVKKDALLNYAISYNELIDDPYGKFVSQTRLKSNLNNRSKDLLKIFSDDYRWGHYDDINLLLNMFYPGWKLSECLNRNKNDIGRFYLQHIFNIARCFITFRDGIVSFRGWHKDNDILISDVSEFDKIELWNHICRTGTPDLFIAASYALLNTTSDDIMCYVPNLIFLADMPLKKVLQKGVAETHLHANAGISYQFLWQNVMKLNYFKEDNNNLWYCRLFRICSAMFIESKSKVTFSEFIIDRKEYLLFETFLKFMNNDTSNVINETMTMKLTNDIKNLFAFEENESDILYSIEFKQYKNSETFAEMIWIYKMLRYFNKKYDEGLFKCFLDYIRYKNNFFKSRIQETAIGGLDYFQNFYNEATNDNYIKSKNDVYYAIFREQLINKNLSLLELKITPKVVPSSETESIAIDSMKRKILHQIRNIISSYKIFLEKHSDDTINSQNIGIIYHFIKSNNSDNYSGINCPIINL